MFIPNNENRNASPLETIEERLQRTENEFAEFKAAVAKSLLEAVRSIERIRTAITLIEER